MNLTALLRVQHEFSGFKDYNATQTVYFMGYILENLFLDLASSFVLIQSCRNKKTSYFYNYVLESVFKLVDAPPIQILRVEENSALHAKAIRRNNLIFVDSYESFRAIDVASHIAQKHVNEFYYILLHAPHHPLLAEMEQIFEYCWFHQLINCNVQVQKPKGNILIYTFFPFTSEKCGSVTPTLINRFDGKRLMTQELFPQKVSNFHGCVLRVATWHLPPFVYLRNETNRRGHIGIEGRLMNTLKERLNFTLEVKVPSNDEKRGLVIGTNVTGALGMLVQNIVDFSLGSFRITAERVGFATPTFSYYQNVQVLLVPRRAYAFTSLEIFLFPFAYSTWLLLFSICLLCVLALTFLRNAHKYFSFHFTKANHPNYCLQVVLLTVGMPICAEPSRNFARILLIVWMFATMILRTFYQALLFHLIRTRLTRPVPSSVEELVDKNYTAVVNYDTYLALGNHISLKSLKYHVLRGQEEATQFQYVENSPYKKLVVIEPLDFLLHYVSVNRMAGVFQVLPGHIFNVPLTIYLRKHSFLVDKFNAETLNLCSMGFIDAWSHQEVDTTYLSQMHNLGDNTFGLNELYMAFVLWFVGCSLALTCFLLEKLSKNNTYNDNND